MKIRMHRGSLEEAMETIKEIEPTLDAVTNYLKAHWGDLYPAKAKIEVQRYVYDHRIGWETFMVTMDGCAVAFTDEPVPSQEVKA